MVRDAGLKLEISEENDSLIEKNHVISQTPSQGTELKKGDTIHIIISLGPKDLSIPNLRGYTLEDAKKVLSQEGLSLGAVSYEYSEIYASGTVINQNPMAGSGNVKKGDAINIVVSKGKKPEDKPAEEEKPNEDGSASNNNGEGNGNANGGENSGGSNGSGTGGTNNSGGSNGSGTDGTNNGGEGNGSGTGGTSSGGESDGSGTGTPPSQQTMNETNINSN